MPTDMAVTSEAELRLNTVALIVRHALVVTSTKKTSHRALLLAPWFRGLQLRKKV